MARREELLISRSRTFLSRRALAARALAWSSLLLDMGIVAKERTGLMSEESGDNGVLGWFVCKGPRSG